jgi:hypothetical protein
LSGNDSGGKPWWQYDSIGHSTRPILIKIILEDDTLMFYQPAGQGDSSDDSEWAVRPGGAHTKMFTCLSPIKTDATTKHKYVTLRVTKIVGDMQSKTAKTENHDIIGGLNIGILVRQGKLWLPIYLDPNIKNNG